MRTPELHAILTHIAGPRVGDNRPKTMVEGLKDYVASVAIPLFPDERELLEEVCKLIDAESDAHTAWRKLNNLDETYRELRPIESYSVHLGVASNVGACTFAYFDRKTRKTATGVLVDIAGRCFVATTSHSVPLDPQDRIVVVTETPTDFLVSTSDNTPQILSFGSTDNGEVKDVAYLEFSPQFVSRNFKRRLPLPLSRINPCGVGLPNHLTFLYGYPAEMVQKRLSGNCGFVEYTPQSWGFTSVLMPEHWELLPDSPRRHSTDIDVFLAYDRESEINKDGVETQEQLPQPFGLSGGGLWQKSTSAEGQIWSPDLYSLIAIQSEWPGQGRYLRATQIEHWLRLVWQEQEELRQVLADAFPSVAFRDCV